MDKFDDRFLAYAMAMGRAFSLSEPALGKGKEVHFVSIDCRRDMPSDPSHADVIAHFIVRQWPDRKVLVKAHSRGKEWTIKSLATGATVSFYGPSQTEVRSNMEQAELGHDPARPLRVSDAKERLDALKKKRTGEARESRLRAWTWPPKEGSIQARAMSLAKVGESFSSVKAFGSLNWGDIRDSSAKAFIAKLKDQSVHLSALVEHPNESKFVQHQLQWRLGPGDAVVEAKFCDVNDPTETEIRVYLWVITKAPH